MGEGYSDLEFADIAKKRHWIVFDPPITIRNNWGLELYLHRTSFANPVKFLFVLFFGVSIVSTVYCLTIDVSVLRSSANKLIFYIHLYFLISIFSSFFIMFMRRETEYVFSSEELDIFSEKKYIIVCYSFFALSIFFPPLEYISMVIDRVDIFFITLLIWLSYVLSIDAFYYICAKRWR